jgi:hypothetical protein
VTTERKQPPASSSEPRARPAGCETTCRRSRPPESSRRGHVEALRAQPTALAACPFIRGTRPRGADIPHHGCVCGHAHGRNSETASGRSRGGGEPVVGNVPRRGTGTIAYALVTAVVALALPVLVVVALEGDLPVRGTVLAGMVLLATLLVVSLFVRIGYRRIPPTTSRALERDGSGSRASEPRASLGQPPSRQRS